MSGKRPGGKGYLRPPVDIQARQTEAPLGAIDWIVCGGETGAKSRPAHPDWVRSLRDQCVNAAVPFYFMGWGDWVHENQIAENMMPKALNSKKMDAHDGCQFVKIGKKHSGRLLDGREWNEMPKVCVEGGQP